MHFLFLSLRLALYTQVAKQCCENAVGCCYQRFIEQEPLEYCHDLGSKWRNATICAEKLLHSSRSVQDDLDMCCYYLTPKQCKSDCLRSLRSPTLNGDEKMAFAERCEQYEFIAEQTSCVARRQILAHECFPTCLRLGRNYNPMGNCMGIKQNDDWCIGKEVPRSELPVAMANRN